jgi:hypothetical protein
MKAKMKAKHNKKRNTAFVYEALIREMARAILTSNTSRKNKILEILRKHFRNGSVLEKELNCFSALAESRGLDKYTAEKMIYRAREAYEKLDKAEIFKEQSKVIGKINKEITPEVFSNFVPNYKSYATISQIFNKNLPVKQKVIMEQEIVKSITSEGDAINEGLKPVDRLVVRTFVKNFNKKYKDLLPEQKNLLGKYILAFQESEADFRVHLVEELTRIKSEVEESLKLEEVFSDKAMVESTNRVIKEINEFNISSVGEKELRKILKLQNLVSEYTKDALQD